MTRRTAMNQPLPPPKSSNVEPPSYFLITSSGASATRWLGGSLNHHPEIRCSCGPGALEIALDYGREVTPQETDKIAEFHLQHTTGSQPVPEPLDSLFDSLEARGRARAYGNIHATWLAFAAFAAIALLLALLIFIGEGVRDALDPRKTFR